MHSIESDLQTKGIDPVGVFVSAIDNEMHRDSYIFRKFPVCQHTSLVIPRLEKMSYLAQTFPRLLAFIANVASVLWPPLLFPVLLLFQAVQALRYLGGASGDLNGNVFYVTSKSSLIFSRSSAFEGKHIYSSKKLERSNPVQDSIGSISDYVILSDIASAIHNSVRALLRIRRSCNTPGTIFQIYPAFAWFLTWSVMNRYAGGLTSVCISNDCDRWAVLFDQLPTSGQRIIVQHGLLNDPQNHQGFRNPEALPTRLKNVDKIILFDKESEEKYRNLVVAADCCPSFICCEKFPIQMNSESNDQNAIQIMIIGQRGHLEQECELANYLARTLDCFCIYVRPHPNSPSELYRKRLDRSVLLIEDLYQYPAVELCICFDYSSLGDIYEKQGARVLYLAGMTLDQKVKDDVRIKALQTNRPDNRNSIT